MMWRDRTLRLRRRLALWICPEVLGPLDQAKVLAPAPVGMRTEHIIRLGHVLQAGTATTDFYAAIGMQRRTHPGPRSTRDVSPEPAGYFMVSCVQNDWRRICKAPPVNIKPKTYVEMLTWFDQNWPAGLDWPRDIPRPSSSQGAGDSGPGEILPPIARAAI